MLDYEDCGIIYNGENSVRFGLYLDKQPKIPLLKRKYDRKDNNRRNGSLIVEKDSYEDREIAVELKFVNVDMESESQEIADWLMSKKDNRLKLDYNSNKCYYVEKCEMQEIEYDDDEKTCGTVSIKFLCEPFLHNWNKRSIELKNGDKINYAGTMEAETLFRINATGTISINVSSMNNNVVENQTFSVADANGDLEIDSEREETRVKSGKLLDDKSEGDYILLKKGINIFTFNSNIKKIILEYSETYYQ